MLNSSKAVAWCIPRAIPLLLGSAITLLVVETYHATHQKPVTVVVAEPTPAKAQFTVRPANCRPCEWRESTDPALWTLMGPKHRVVARIFLDSGYPGYWMVFDGSNPRRQLSEWGTLADAKESAERLVAGANPGNQE